MHSDAAMTTTDPVAELQEAVLDAAAELSGGKRPGNARLSRPPKPDFGDYSSNAPMLMAPVLSQPPRAVAESLGELVTKRLGDDLDRVDVAGPGFLNLFMAEQWFRQSLARTAAVGDDCGRGSPDQAERTQVEFASAHPSGPANAAPGRHAAFGDSLARILEFAGHDVQREYYVNDYGGQVRRFGESIKARARGEDPPEDGYQGEYVIDVAKRIEKAAELDPDDLAPLGVELIVEEVRATLERYRVTFDRFFHVRELYERGMVDRSIDLLREHGHVY